MPIKKWVSNGPCNQCGSKNNLATYSDDQQWCWGCGFYKKGDSGLSNDQIREQLQQQQKGQSDVASAGVSLPRDYTTALPTVAVQWLLKYGITKGERIKNRIGWSDHYESLILPVFDLHNNLELVQRRYFGDGPWPKYHTKGHPDKLIHVHGNRELPTAVLVEDFISSIKVGREHNGVCLWGSNVSNEKIKGLSHRFENIIIWLDKDKASSAVKFKLRAQPFFKRVSVIVTELDPKEYNNEAIAEAISLSSAGS